MPSVGGCWTSTSCFRSPTVFDVAAEADGPPKRPDILCDLQSFVWSKKGRIRVKSHKSGEHDSRQFGPVTVAVIQVFPLRWTPRRVGCGLL